ncbi:MAG: 2-oxoglutarate dehydrogenase complex dihydrolipoyllysine-residue succinyltransferase [Bacteroidetes bacterium]|nr:MAG: 2-oxoglutarate dehydrogenase complex dihydrolipoyllysine-residue succinyltransferase [Bacteroidota bacterium]
MIDIKVPTVGESISEVTLLKWTKKDGDYVERDEVIAELESEKATFEVNAEKAGVIKLEGIKEGDSIKIGDKLASIDEKASKPSNGKPAKEKSEVSSQESGVEKKEEKKKKEAKTENKNEEKIEAEPAVILPEGKHEAADVKASPVAAAMIADKKVDLKKITPSGPEGKILKEDVLAALSNPGRRPGAESFSRNEKPEKMSNLRKTISRRLVEAKNTTAMLTTFNEVNMQPVMDIRNKYKDKFKEIHGVGLGFMSFFVKACCYALQEWPSANAYIDGDNIVYHDYCDVSIAVSTPRELTVPVIRNAESLSMSDIEKKVIELAGKARDSKLTAEDLTGGTFTITNGAIINIPQSAILGMHKIEERPIALNGQVVIKPMMYVALSYDHRIIDGRESVSFLVRVKELLENPDQLLFGKDPLKTLLEL